MNPRTLRGIRQIACPELETPQGIIQTPHVVELSNGKVVRYYPLTRELPYTEWMRNRLRLCRNEQGEMTLWDDKEPVI